jgi:MSHA pilin protein MshD
MPHPSRSSPRLASCTEQRGLTLVELVLFIAVVGIALTGVLAVYDRAVRGSADPLLRKQAVAAAESLLAEVLLQPFTWCDPQDPANDASAPPSAAADCTTPQDAGGPLGPAPPGESRGAVADPLDNIADYHGLNIGPGIVALDGTAPPELAAYSARVTVTRAGAGFGLPDGAVLRIDVEVTGRGEAVTLTGYRVRHSPNATG